ncbi:bifunctional diguanylate cyclase/phosphodiesterase [Ferrimonas lipolytica]|uniref:GGDEF domain-containing protein n=1 Tax=Ferrimonas lipolytica TaxID=2724191 RepID=A0A6H1UB98_9GAMM|nr:bifunctional diguanylate cyclase/phosphodiesterase [Ferrimonas lipolytica]QIZ76331.1 GGDEF domain-containing protein [Ferrimonas lipolytica]
MAEHEQIDGSESALVNAGLDASANAVTQRLVNDFNCSICTTWLFSNDRQHLTCLSRCANQSQFSTFSSLHRSDFPQFFRFFDHSNVLVAEAARLHPATSCFNQTHLIVDGIHSLFALTIEINPQCLGLVILEFDYPTQLMPEQILNAQRLTNDLGGFLNGQYQLQPEIGFKLFECAIENTKQRIIIIEADTLKVVYVNDALANFNRQSPHWLVGQSIKKLRSYKQFPQQCDALIVQALAQRHIDGEFTITGVDGMPQWFEYEARAITVGDKDYVVSLSEDVSAQRCHQQKLESLAWRCQLSGLNNRSKCLSDLKNQKLPLLMLIDIRGFKNLNDRFGEQFGDGVLKEVGRRINHFCEAIAGSHAYRIGADEFVIGFETTPTTELVDIAISLGKRLHAEIVIDGHIHRIDTIMAGLELSVLSEQISPLAALDMAMIKAKQCRSFQLFDEQIQQRFLDETELESELKSAVARRQIELHFQPLIDVSRGVTSGAEVLIRWQHPRLGLIYPGRFIDIAERSGLIEPIGRWVFESALYQLYLWQRRWPELQMHVNVSVKQLLTDEFFEICWNQLNRYRVKPGSLVLEITENTLMEDVESVGILCEQLGELGLVLAIDDFGTGYSSMSYLKQLPVQKLKIDRSFIADLEHSKESRLIVPAIVAMGKALNMKITAEGVENQFQEQFLRKHLCDEIQGFFYSKAIPATSFENHLVSHSNA